MFFRGSRYEHVPEAELTTADGRTVRYKRMRFAAPAAGPTTGVAGDDARLDVLAYRTLGDPEQFWRLCDANEVLRPVDLTAVPGRAVRVPGPGTE
jgi:hypothetical protein